jgi:lactoylglutathione lyase
MRNRINHIHLKASDPRKTAEWWAKAFAFTIVSDDVRASGDRFVRCRTEDGVMVNISGSRKGETLGPAVADVHLGLEHLGFESVDLDADLLRLQDLGARVLEGPLNLPNARVAFLGTPDDVRIELIQRIP